MAHNFKKRYGQNFLKNTRFAWRLVEASDPQEGDNYIEIGPGDGNITQLLLESRVNVTSIEVDYDLIPKLIKRFDIDATSPLQLVHKDILQIDAEFYKRFEGKQVKVIGSLPYNISKKIINKLLTDHENGLVKIQSMTFIVQEEVSQDIVAVPPKGNFFSTLMHLRSKVRKFESIPARHFFPVPKVNGGILQISPVDNGFSQDLIKFIKNAFSSPRKQMVGNLANSKKWSSEQIKQAMRELGISETARAQEVLIEQWRELYAKLGKGVETVADDAEVVIE